MTSNVAIPFDLGSARSHLKAALLLPTWLKCDCHWQWSKKNIQRFITSKTLFHMWPFILNFLILADQLSLDQMSSQQKSRRRFLPESIMYLIDSHAFSVSCKSELFSFKTGSKTNNNQGNNGTNHRESWFSSLLFWNAATLMKCHNNWMPQSWSWTRTTESTKHCIGLRCMCWQHTVP